MPRRKKAEVRPPVSRHLIDTNVILRFLIGDDPPKAAAASGLMGRVERGEELVEVQDVVLTETVWTLESFYEIPRNEIAEHLAALLSFAGVRVASRELLLQALQDYAGSNADFVDCLLAARSKHRGIAVYTFDKTDFKKLRADWEEPL